MKSMPLAAAKAHISELCNQVEHQGKSVLITRHGKPVAAIVPVAVTKPKRRRHQAMSDAEVTRSVQAFVDEFSAAEPDVSAVDDLLLGRR